MDINLRANTIIQALPYVKEFHNKTIVIKYGGNAMISETLKSAVIEDLVMLSLIGMNVVFIHGGGPEISHTLKQLNIESKFINGLRYTDDKTIDVVQMVLCGKINKDLVKLIECEGGNAVGLCGIDGNMLVSEKINDDEFDYGYVGKVKEVNIKPIDDIISKGYIPVIAPLGVAENGDVLNINADTAAAQIAIALKAEKFILLTDVQGIMKDYKDENSLISAVNIKEIEQLKKDGIISGGMIPKVDCCIEAVKGNVTRTHIIDGRVPHSILIEMLSDEGIGTMITL